MESKITESKTGIILFSIGISIIIGDLMLGFLITPIIILNKVELNTGLNQLCQLLGIY